MTEHLAPDAMSLADAFRAGRLDPVAVFDAALEAAGASGPTFIALTAARGRREAEAAARRWRDGAPASPLDGVPIAWKDLFDIAGTVTTAGAAFRRDAAAALTDAALVAAASRNGMPPVGKTNLSELAFSGLGLNPHYGTPVHPRDPSLVPGGSSSGSAVAVAAGIVPFAFGSDTAGSVRVPAAINDIYGYRPSRGRYSLDGVFPLAPTFDTAGPFARSLRDLALLDAVLTGTDDAVTTDRPAPVLIVDDALLGDDRVTDDVRARFEAALDAAGRHGVRIERRRRTALGGIGALIERDGWLGGAEAYATHAALLDGSDAARLDPAIRARLALGAAMPLVTAVRLYQARETAGRAVAAEAGAAVFVMPAIAHRPPALREVGTVADFTRVNVATLRLSAIGSFVGMPGITVPLGDGIGLLVTAPDGEDARVFAAAAAIAEALT